MNYDKKQKYVLPFPKYFIFIYFIMISLAMEKNVPQRPQPKASRIIQHGHSPMQIFIRQKGISLFQVVKHTFFHRFLLVDVS